MVEDPSNSNNFNDNQIEAWLGKAGFSQYVEIFKQEEIEFDILSEISNDDLKEMRIPLGDRKRILRAIADLSLMPDQILLRPRKTEVIERIDTPEAAVVRRHLTIAFCDLVGSTDLADRLDPEEVGEVIRDYKACCMAAVDRWEGKIVKFLGDGVLVLFGWPIAHEDDAERAIHAGLEITEAVSKLHASDGTELSARVGIATGLVVIGDVGVDGLVEKDAVVGATPNRAARVQSEAKPGEVAIDPLTRKLIGQRFDLDSLGTMNLKGISEPVELWLAKGVLQGMNRFEARMGNSVTPFVGREAEVSMLTDGWDRCEAEGIGGTFLISGEAGIGKSRLLQVLSDYTMDAQQMRFQCFPYYTNTVLLPFVEWLNNEAEIASSTVGSEALVRIEGLVQRWHVESSDAVQLIAALLSVPFDQRYPPLRLSPLRLRERTIEFLIELIELASRVSPVLLTVEDLHWADPTTLELLTIVAQKLDKIPVLLVLTARTSDFGKEFNRIRLSRLEERDVTEMVKNLFKDSQIPMKAIASIAKSAEGIPLFVEELARAVGDSWNNPDESASIPIGLKGLLAARLDNLSEGKEITDVAAAIGRSFSSELIQHLVEQPIEVVRDQLEKLRVAGIFEKNEGSDGIQMFSFCQSLIRDTAYQAQLRSSRRDMHGRIAMVLYEHFPQTAETEPELLGQHFLKAGSLQSGARYLLKAGRKALLSSAVKEGVNNLLQGLGAIKKLPKSRERDETELLLQATLGIAYMQAKGWAAEEVQKAYYAAGQLSYAAKTTSEAIWILWGNWVYHQVRGRISEGEKIIVQIEQLATDDIQGSSKLVADMILFQGHFYGGRLEESEKYQYSFMRAYRRDRHRPLTDLYSTDLEMVSCVHRSISLWILGRTDEALEQSAKSEALMAELDHPHSIAWGNTWGAVVPLLQKDVAKVEEKIADGLALADEQGFAYVEAMGKVFLGWANAQRGDASKGVSLVDQGMAEFLATGAEIAMPFFQTLKAQILFQLGEFDEALALLDKASDQVENWGERWQESEIFRVRGKILSVQGLGKNAEAEKEFADAIEVAEKQKASAWQLRATNDYVIHLNRLGRESESKALLERLTPSFDGMRNCPDVAIAQALLKEIN